VPESKTGPSLREMLTGSKFHYGAELVSTRGIATPEHPSSVVALGEALGADPRISWISATDNPGGNPMLPADWLARILDKGDTNLVVHLTCKDRNRNGLESAAWQMASEGFNNILAMTGDYPRAGFGGTARPVFDLDSVGLIGLLKAMNGGLEVIDRGKPATLPKTDFYIGCAGSPFKQHERELMPQYFKLLRKIACGAEFVISQLGYDMRKFCEMKQFLASHGIDVPVVGNVYLLTGFVAKLFNRGEIPGCVVSDELLGLAEKYGKGPDKGRAFFRELAAKQLAVFKGFGFAAGYIGGISKADTFFDIIDMAEGFGENDWKEFAKEIQFCKPNEFYLFNRDPETGLGNPSELNPEYIETLKQPIKSKEVTLGYQISRKVHDWFFTPGEGFFNVMKRIYSKWDKEPNGLSKAAHTVEKFSKSVCFGCEDCGDCSLPEAAYLCPMAACSKGGRNGPCGGSSDGQCDLKDKECIWARAYERLKYYGETGKMLKGKPVYYNAELDGTSSWANTFLGRDHAAAGKEEEKKEDS
jgi:methylenetetrahydrofolate reductase (NADPH)